MTAPAIMAFWRVQSCACWRRIDTQATRMLPLLPRAPARAHAARQDQATALSIWRPARRRRRLAVSVDQPDAQFLRQGEHHVFRLPIQLAHGYGASARRRASTPSTSTSGAEAPAVTPTRVCRPASPGRSRRRRRSTTPARAFALSQLAQAVRVGAVGGADHQRRVAAFGHEVAHFASWRFWVA